VTSGLFAQSDSLIQIINSDWLTEQNYMLHIPSVPGVVSRSTRSLFCGESRTSKHWLVDKQVNERRIEAVISRQTKNLPSSVFTGK
jgi:hypothetical protein